MFCKYCGAQLEEGTAFCTNCGADLREAAQPVCAEPGRVQPVNNNSALNTTPILTLGIVAAAVSWIGIPGIIIGCIGRSKVKNYLANGGIPCGKSKTGSILSKVGIFAGIGFTVFWALYIALIVGIFALIGYYG